MNSAGELNAVVRCLADDRARRPAEPYFFIDDGGPPLVREDCLGVVVPADGAGRARELLGAGVQRVLIGEAALHEAGLIETLASEFGPGRVGVYVPAARMRAHWSMNSVSNADFKFMAPSVCEPNWEVLTAKGGPTGVHVDWWVGRMLEREAASVLVRADIEDDADLNICAGLVELCGERLWLGSRARSPNRLSDWVLYGRVRQLAFVPALYEHDEQVLGLRDTGGIGIGGPPRQEVA